MKKHSIFTLLLFCSLLISQAAFSPAFALAQQNEQFNERTAQLGQKRGTLLSGSEIWTYGSKAGDVLTIKAQADEPAAQCEEGTQLALSGKPSEALPLLEAGFAARKSATFADPDDEGYCALILGQLRSNFGNLSGALEAYQVARDLFQTTGNRQFEGIAVNSIGMTYSRQGKYQSALEQYRLALTIKRELADRIGEGETLNNMAVVYHSQGQYELALGQFQRVLTIMRELENRAGEGTVLNNMGNIYDSLGEYNKALEHYQQALEIRHEVGDRAGKGATLNNIGSVYDNQGQYDEALAHYEQALEIFREVGNRSAEGNALNNMGLVYSSQGQYELALEQFEQALAIKREVGDPVLEASTLSNIGTVYDNQEKYDQALELYEQALEVFRAVGNPESEGTTLNNMASVYRNQGRYNEALAYYEQALEISREIGDRASEGTILSNIGRVYEDQGKYDQALELHQLALKISREVENRAGESDALNNIAVVYARQGKYDQALESYQEALEIFREVGDRAGEGTTWNGIGVIYDKQGKYEEALAFYQDALDIRQEIGDRAGEGTTLDNIGSVYRVQEQYNQALAHYKQALEIVREEGNRVEAGTTLNNIGTAYQSQGRFDLALDTFQQALTIQREIGDRVGEGATLYNIGTVYREQGRFTEALEVYQKALAIWREVGNQSGEVTTLQNISVVYQQQGQPEQALDYYEQALAVFESGYSEGEPAIYFQQTDLYTNTIALYYQQDQGTKAFLTSERSRAWRSEIVQAQSRNYKARDLLKKEQEINIILKAVRNALVHIRATERADSTLVADLEVLLEEFNTIYNAVLGVIEGEDHQLPMLQSKVRVVLPLPVVQALLDEHTTLVSYYVLDGKRTLAFVITHDDFNMIELPEATSENLNTAVTNLYNWSNLEDSHPKPLRDLHTWLVAPVAEYLNTPLVGIIPHETLHKVPFAALTDGERYFIYDYAVFTLPSASDLPFLQANRPSDTGMNTMLALGNPTTGAGLPSLRYAEEEVEYIAELYETEPLIGQEATENAIKTQASAANILHLAIHCATYKQSEPLDSTINLARDGTDDGRLKMYEVNGLDLAATNLVVLNSCQTEELSTGVLGFSRAFMLAGAPTVMTGLWPQDDEATTLFMKRFYTHLRAGDDEVRALRAATIELQAKYPSPFYWATFFLTGLPKNNGKELVPAEELLLTLAPPPPVWPWLLGLSSLLGLVLGLTSLSYSSGLPATVLIRQKSHIFTVARNYRSYRQRWQDASPITRLMVLLAPLSEEVESKQLLKQFDKLNAPVESGQLENELNVAVREGLLRRVDGGYCLGEPHLARALQAHEGARGRVALAEQIRDTHPLCINGHRFLEKAGFMTLTLIEEPLLYRCDALAVNWRELLPPSVYVRFLPGEILDGQQVRDIRRKVTAVDPKASVVFVMTDKRLPDDGWAQIGTLEMESFTVLPIESTLINEGLAAGNEQTRLRTEIEKRRGGEYDPYKVTTPVTGAFSFFGRDGMIKSLLPRITSGQPVGVFGLRKLGKSSLLHAIQEQAPFPVAFVNLETIERSQGIANLYQRIVNDWASWLPVRFALKWEPPIIASNAPTDSFVRAIRELLDFLEKEHEQARVGVFLDEIELIVPRPVHQGTDLSRYLSLLRPLRGLVDEGVPLSLVVAGLNPALNRFDDWEGERNPAYSLFEEINLPPLTDKDCIRMIRSIGAQIGLAYSDESLQLISELSGGHPFLARQLCSLLYKRRQYDKRQRIEESEVMQTAQKFIYDDSTVSRLRAIWKDLGNKELWGAASAETNHSLLLDLARAGHPVPEHDLLNHPDADARQVALINLERYHIIHQPQTGRYAIRFGLLENWLRRRKLGLTRTSDHESRG